MYKQMEMAAIAVAGMHGLRGQSGAVLAYMLKHMNFSNEITIASGSLTVMSEEIGVLPSTIKKALKGLEISGIAISACRGCYIVSPEVFTLREDWPDEIEDAVFLITSTYRNDDFKVAGRWQ